MTHSHHSDSHARAHTDALPAEPPRSVTLDRRGALKLLGSACAVSALSGCLTKLHRVPELGTSFAFDLSDPLFAPLKTVGEAVDVDNAAGYKIILIRLNEEEIIALDRVCTHSNCDMKLGALGAWDGEKVICRCHDSHFSPRGEVLKSPATRPLPTYDVAFSSGSDQVQVLFAEAAPVAGEQAGESAGEQAGESAGAQAGESAGESTIEVPEQYRDLTNPFDGDAQAVTDGQTLYDQNCGFCHGAAGVGDTFPGASAFTIDQSQWSDGYLFWVLAEGIEGTSMAAYDSLSEEDRWRIVSYLRSLRTDQ